MRVLIIDAAIYADGQRVATIGSLDELEAWRANGSPAGSFLWIGLRLPSDAELEVVGSAIGWEGLTAKSFKHIQERPRLDLRPGSLALLVRPARYVEERELIELGELFCYVGTDFVVTIRFGQASPLTGVRAELEVEPESLASGPSAVLRAILERVVSDYVPVVRSLEHDVREVERELWSTDRRDPSRRIYFLIRETLDFLVGIEPLTSTLERLRSNECRPIVGSAAGNDLADLHDRLERVIDRSRNVRALLDNAMSAHLAQLSVRQNDDMRKLAAWVAIAAVPTMVAGVYGMNFEHMPELSHPAGYPAVLVGMATVCIAMYRSFRRRGWL